MYCLHIPPSSCRRSVPLNRPVHQARPWHLSPALGFFSRCSASSASRAFCKKAHAWPWVAWFLSESLSPCFVCIYYCHCLLQAGAWKGRVVNSPISYTIFPSLLSVCQSSPQAVPRRETPHPIVHNFPTVPSRPCALSHAGASIAAVNCVQLPSSTPNGYNYGNKFLFLFGYFFCDQPSRLAQPGVRTGISVNPLGIVITTAFYFSHSPGNLFAPPLPSDSSVCPFAL